MSNLDLRYDGVSLRDLLMRRTQNRIFEERGERSPHTFTPRQQAALAEDWSLRLRLRVERVARVAESRATRVLVQTEEDSENEW